MVRDSRGRDGGEGNAKVSGVREGAGGDVLLDGEKMA
jgi:hypothetical protein